MAGYRVKLCDLREKGGGEREQIIREMLKLTLLMLEMLRNVMFKQRLDISCVFQSFSGKLFLEISRRAKDKLSQMHRLMCDVTQVYRRFSTIFVFLFFFFFYGFYKRT